MPSQLSWTLGNLRQNIPKQALIVVAFFGLQARQLNFEANQSLGDRKQPEVVAKGAPDGFYEATAFRRLPIEPASPFLFPVVRRLPASG